MEQKQDHSRRNFLRQAGLSGIALTLGSYLPAAGRGIAEIFHAPASSTELMAWITIDSAGLVTIFNHRSEMGQGTSLAIPQIIAEELEVDFSQVIVRSVAANPSKYGPQPSDGSFSVRGWYQQLLRIGATARELMIQAAANQWAVTVSDCYAQEGQVIHRPSGKKLSYGELVQAAAQLPVPQQVKLKARKDYTLIGRGLPRKDIPGKVNGTAVFGLDKKLPGMLYAVVERSPAFRGKVKTIDDTATKKLAGVKQVLKVERDVFGLMLEGVAVVADNLWAAMQGRKLLKIEWDDTGIEPLSSALLVERMKQEIQKPVFSEKFETALKYTGSFIEAEYEVPYQSHSCMEPLNCIADVRENSVEIWGPIQEANWIQADLSARLHIPAENITVNMTYLGGGFGRKAFPDYPCEAALISKAVNAPVQVMWTREDDMSAGPFRAGAVYRCRAGIDSRQKIAAIQVITATQYHGPGHDQEAQLSPIADNTGRLDGLPADYVQSIPHYCFVSIPVKSHIPTMWWRAPGANVDAFAGECFIDELAHLAKQDPVSFRKAHLTSARYHALVDKLAEISNWNARGNHEGWGVAITESFGSLVGQVVKVSRGQDKKVSIDTVYAVIDCGWYVNPDTIRAQVEGSIVMALGAAITHATHFAGGKAVEKNFNTYPMPRLRDIPAITVHIMENDEKPGGVGEPGLPAFAPALCNAIFDLTGKRVRKLPFVLGDL